MRQHLLLPLRGAGLLRDEGGRARRGGPHGLRQLRRRRPALRAGHRAPALRGDPGGHPGGHRRHRLGGQGRTRQAPRDRGGLPHLQDRGRRRRGGQGLRGGQARLRQGQRRHEILRRSLLRLHAPRRRRPALHRARRQDGHRLGHPRRAGSRRSPPGHRRRGRPDPRRGPARGPSRRCGRSRDRDRQRPGGHEVRGALRRGRQRRRPTGGRGGRMRRRRIRRVRHEPGHGGDLPDARVGGRRAPLLLGRPLRHPGLPQGLGRRRPARRDRVEHRGDGRDRRGQGLGRLPGGGRNDRRSPRGRRRHARSREGRARQARLRRGRRRPRHRHGQRLAGRGRRGEEAGGRGRRSEHDSRRRRRRVVGSRRGHVGGPVGFAAHGDRLAARRSRRTGRKGRRRGPGGRA